MSVIKFELTHENHKATSLQSLLAFISSGMLSTINYLHYSLFLSSKSGLKQLS